MMALGSLVASALFVAIGMLAWDSATAYLAHPARALAAAYVLVLTVVAVRSGVNFSAGKREDTRNRWVFLPFVAGSVAYAWLPPYMDCHDLWTIDGDATRWLGFAVLVAGGVLRVWPMFVLGRRFSGLVAIQEGHELVTDGPYRLVRNPSYLGMLLAFAGWALVFRSSVGLVMLVPAVWITLARIAAEETLLRTEFGAAYGAYCRRSWRLVPRVY
jgi:protein-S-isoprenylcysteine O-methyltransferase Ste14